MLIHDGGGAPGPGHTPETLRGSDGRVYVFNNVMSIYCTSMYGAFEMDRHIILNGLDFDTQHSSEP